MEKRNEQPSGADFVLMVMKELQQKELPAEKAMRLAIQRRRPLAIRLNILATELARIQREGNIISQIKINILENKGVFSAEEQQTLQQAKDIIIDSNRKRLPDTQRKLTEFFASNPTDLNEKYINFVTDGALNELNLVKLLPNKSSLDIHNEVLDSRLFTNMQAKSFIIHFSIDKVFSGATQDDINVALRNHANAGNHFIVDACLKRGGDPRQPGHTSNQSAIDRARGQGFTDLAKLMEDFNLENTSEGKLFR